MRLARHRGGRSSTDANCFFALSLLVCAARVAESAHSEDSCAVRAADSDATAGQCALQVSSVVTTETRPSPSQKSQEGVPQKDARSRVGAALLQDESETDAKKPPRKFQKIMQAIGDKIRAATGLQPTPNDMLPTFKDKAQMTAISTVRCNQTVYAPLGSCPDNCPYFGEEPESPCHFRCVDDLGCRALNPQTGIADKDQGVCRTCSQTGCQQCDPTGLDKCVECLIGHQLRPDGSCSNRVMTMIVHTVLGVISALLLFILAWIAALALHPVVNQEGLNEGLAYRSRLILRQPANENTDNRSRMWPLGVDMLDQPEIAGPGLLLHFSFQYYIIVWSLTTLSFWLIWTWQMDHRLVSAGDGPQDDDLTAVDLCAMAIDARLNEHQLMMYKVGFLVIVYVYSVIGSLMMAWWHSQEYQASDDNTNTMQDYVLRCTGIPRMSGDSRAEEELTEAARAATGQDVVGVSIAWDIGARADQIQKAVEADSEEQERKVRAKFFLESANAGDAADAAQHHEREHIRRSATFQSEALGPPGDPSDTEAAERPQFCYVWSKVNAIFGFGMHYSPPEVPGRAEKANLATDVNSTDTAFLVFRTQDARDEALQALPDGFDFRGCNVRFSRVYHEPDVVNWYSFSTSNGQRVLRCVYGWFAVLLGALVWCGCFYLPYTLYATASHAGQEDVSSVSDTVFSLIVVGGNQAMYFLCQALADNVGFNYKDTADAFYVVTYTFSCLLNVCVDLMLEFYLGYHAMVQQRAHTDDGRLLSDLASTMDVFNSYPMQTVMGRRLFAYAFPSTFLIPFLMEPIFSMWLPYVIQVLLLRTHPGVRGREAEKSMDFFTPMDLGRYGDVVLNVMLLTMVFVFPANSFSTLMVYLILSHVYIYFYDKLRVLRHVPAFDCSDNTVDRAALMLLTVPCGIILVCAIMEANCYGWAFTCFADNSLAVASLVAFLLHVAVHLGLFYLAFHFESHESVSNSQATYESVSQKLGCNWFTSNPMHCMRSKYLYEHHPPAFFFERGREYIQAYAPNLGNYFSSKIDSVLLDEEPNSDAAHLTTLEHLRKTRAELMGGRWRRPKRTTGATESATLASPSARSFPLLRSDQPRQV